jgi:uncharacterized membrane protein
MREPEGPRADQPARRRHATLLAIAQRFEQAEALDGPAAAVERCLPAMLTGGAGRSLLGGRWLGHSLHPLLTDFPLGFWASASWLDLVGGARARPAAQRLVASGLLFAVPTAAAGLSDWSRLSRTDQRVGLMHAQLNALATVLYGTSYLARRRGSPATATVLGVLGGLSATAGGFFGGHLTLTRSVTRDNALLPSDDGDDTGVPGDT